MKPLTFSVTTKLKFITNITQALFMYRGLVGYLAMFCLGLFRRIGLQGAHTYSTIRIYNKLTRI